MKKGIIFSIIVALLLVTPVFVLAQENTSTSNESVVDEEMEMELDALEADPGVLPDNPTFVVKRWLEEVQLFFTFDGTKKAELVQKFALKRVIEAEKLIAKGKADVAERHLQRYEKQLAKFEERIVKLEEKDPARAEEMLERFEQIQARQQAVLEKVYNQVSENAQESVLKAMERSMHGIEQAIERVQQNTQEEINSFRMRAKDRFDDEKDSIREEVRLKLEERGVFGDENAADDELNFDNTDEGVEESEE